MADANVGYGPVLTVYGTATVYMNMKTGAVRLFAHLVNVSGSHPLTMDEINARADRYCRSQMAGEPDADQWELYMQAADGSVFRSG